MSQTAKYIRRLTKLKEGDRSRLRRLAGCPLDETLQGFDLFAGLWWPLRTRNSTVPRREPSWLVAKLYGAFPVPHKDGNSLPKLLGRCEPSDDRGCERFRRRFDALLCSGFSTLEPGLRWALGEAAKAAAGKVAQDRGVRGVDWVRLLDELSIWERGGGQRRGSDIREIWAEEYLGTATQASTQRRKIAC